MSMSGLTDSRLGRLRDEAVVAAELPTAAVEVSGLRTDIAPPESTRGLAATVVAVAVAVAVADAAAATAIVIVVVVLGVLGAAGLG